MIQVARLRRAWSAVSLYFKQCDTDRSKVSATDLDSLLGDSELRDAKVAFWTRYRVRLPPELYPSDATVSRVSREMSKRLLCVFDVWKVRSLQFQLTSCSKKRKLADTLFVEEDADEDTVARDWEGYLDKLYTLLVACALAARAGCQVLQRRLGRPSWADSTMSSWPTTTGQNGCSEELALVPPPGAGDDGVRTVEGHTVFRMRVCGGPEQTPVPQTQRPGDRGVAAFDVPSYSPPPRVGTTGEFRRQVVPV